MGIDDWLWMSDELGGYRPGRHVTGGNRALFCDARPHGHSSLARPADHAASRCAARACSCGDDRQRRRCRAHGRGAVDVSSARRDGHDPDLEFRRRNDSVGDQRAVLTTIVRVGDIACPVTALADLVVSSTLSEAIVGLLKSIRRRAGDCSPRLDEVRGCGSYKLCGFRRASLVARVFYRSVCRLALLPTPLAEIASCNTYWKARQISSKDIKNVEGICGAPRGSLTIHSVRRETDRV
ncbi:hypothetical protein BN2476_250017 [Paraburkholderia piptadeniae]|uniref:Uncharacterized protein n=1 Tax=Paraburkholderia piptadeniae TaxID=1701573 RepID=A0A1N7S026_9BURK|nr:hypothetical protein BN2476_250017 [Paraburkholderia piptadeniae]